MKGCLQAKHGKYYAVLSVNGKKRWINTQIPTTKGNKRKAEQKMAEIIVRYGENPEEFRHDDFSVLAMQWLQYVKGRVDIITYEGYEQFVLKHIIPYFKKLNKSIQEIRIKDIEDYYNFKATAGRLDGKKGGLSYRTIRLHSATLKLIFKYAVINGFIKENPCTYAVIPKNIERPRRIESFYSADECKKLLEVTEGTALHDIVLLTFLYGLRRSEVMGLRFQDIDFESGTITIQHTRVLKKTVVSKDKTKNASSNRIYPLLDDVKEVLLKIKKQKEYYRSVFGNTYYESDYVFTTEQGKPYYPSYPSHRLAHYIDKYELPHIRFHDLRHSCASYLLSKGWSMKSISEWLGHSEISTTMNIYAHVDLSQKRKLAKQLENTFIV